MKLVVSKTNVQISEVVIPSTELFDGMEIFVGRSEDCHVFIDDPLISRHHFVLIYGEQNITVTKLSNHGDLKINGENTTKHKYSLGDVISFAGYTLQITDIPSKQKNNDFSVSLPTNKLESIPEPSISMPAPAIELTETVVLSNKNVSKDKHDSIQEENIDQDRSDTDFQDDKKDDPSEEKVGAEELDTMSFSDDEPSFQENPSEDIDAEIQSEHAQDESTQGFNTDEMASSDGESTKVFQSFANYELHLFGEHAPYDRFVLDKAEIFVGRDSARCDIALNDPEVSSVHAAFRKNLMSISVEDLNSSNGTLVNGKRVKKVELHEGDEVVIGSTTFTVVTTSDLLAAESDSLMPVEDNQVIETEEIVEEEVSADEMPMDGSDPFGAEAAPVEKSFIKRILKDPKKKKIVYAVGLLLLVSLFFDDGETPPENADAKKEQVATDATKAKSGIDSKQPTNENKNERQYTKEETALMEASYRLAQTYVNQDDLVNARIEIDKVRAINPNYKNTATIYELIVKKEEAIKEKKLQEEKDKARAELKKVVDELVEKAKEAVKNRDVSVAESYFAQIMQKDPENLDIQPLKLELESWQKEEERKALEKAQKEAERKRMVDALAVGKNLYLKKEWYQAANKLDDFLKQKGMDEDLVKEATEMLEESRNAVLAEINPILGKARSLKEGQDLKGAYEAYLDILKIEPTNVEALSQIDEIRDALDTRSKKIYREGIIAESLSLFNDAKEKFQEVQQISPTDSIYYEKATQKLKNYLE